MSDVTHILSAIEQGDARAAEQLLPLVYNELRRLAEHKLAREAPGHTLEATALVHEAYLRLVTPPEAPRSNMAKAGVQWNGRGHFFAAAAEAMRRILIERARRKRRAKHGGDRRRIELDDALVLVEPPSTDLLALDEALGQLELADPAAAKLVKLRYFAGLSLPQVAEALGTSLRQAERDWTYARTWLHRALSQSQPSESPKNGIS
jgi:RNA polymerase sigma factor (TIGR02999 family)